MGNLQGKSIIITGAAMGLGYAASLECVKQGAQILMVDYNEEALKQAKAGIEQAHKGAKIVTTLANVAEEKEVKQYVELAVKEFSRVDGLYNNAGIEGRQAPITTYDIDVFKKVIDINLLGVYYGLRYVLPVMQQQQYGRIVNVASVGGIRGVMHQMPYVASKHAVAGMTKNVALEYAQYNINANAIAPGAILTPMVAEAFKQVNPKDPKAAETEYSRANPTKRLGLPEEVASVVAFLLSDGCSYVNGQILAIDGGQSNSYGNV
ncbi:NAD(P)-dependent dehydrogenase (short-subunit alcohol dehydrogenase family) [Chitinophaga skermanii]|uniref:NAD(P)-dependent dehydrogenase (Short-subunit alcohol dehydrogenase family) n=1 Tax=Chitinophaga skermanii TaxID=331697 RepID=A0A327QNW3_9BACT|nr:SDR family oxidoreductase [Chitinophaga skermanii]RAJ05384.1 NAD(P)-dependent dehydrogenase (short-subunit alcohol dehydrogenase family) [Chitinophaga skermanii]